MAGPESRRSVQAVISNDDLLTEILLRLPVLSLILFKSVSKHWYSLIKQASISLIKADNRNPDPPCGLFICMFTLYNEKRRLFNYNFVLLDTRIPLLPTNSFAFGPKLENDSRAADIWDSCNGLLLYRPLSSGNLYVYNPSITNMFNVLPKTDNGRWFRNHVYGGFKLAFDPTKSSYYKVIYAERVVHGLWVQIHTFSSETGNWSLCGHQFSRHCFIGFKFGVYWNDAICWSTGGEVFKLDIMNEHPVLTTLPTPPNTIYKPSPIYLLFESRGCLLLVASNNILSRHCTIYEKRSVYSEWSVKYTVNLDDVAERCSHERIIGIVLGEREEDSFLVWLLGRKVVQHKIVSKTLSTISELGPNDDLLGCYQFIPSFAHV